jgi:hypothetical protein
LQRAVNEFDVTSFYLDVDPSALAAARQSLDESGLLLLGEVHGVRQNPLIARELMVALDVTGLALEWPAGLATGTSGFLADGNVPDHPQLWGGDGRITAGHFALLRERFMAEGLQSLTLFDGVNEVGWSRREAAMADRIISAQAPGARTLVIAGNAHTALSPTGLGVPLGARLAERRPGVREIRVNYGNGSYYNLSPQRFKRHWTLRRKARLHSDGAALVLELPSPVQARVPHRMQSNQPLRPSPPGYTGSFPAHSTGSFPVQNTGALPVQSTGAFPARDAGARPVFEEPGDHRQYPPPSEPAQPYPASQPYPPGQPYPLGQPYQPSQSYPPEQFGGGAHPRDRAQHGRHSSSSSANPPGQRRGHHTVAVEYSLALMPQSRVALGRSRSDPVAGCRVPVSPGRARRGQGLLSLRRRLPCPPHWRPAIAGYGRRSRPGR